MKIKTNISWHANPKSDLLSWICTSKTHALELKYRKETVVGIYPEKSQTPTEPLVYFSLTGWGENIRKARCLVNWNNESLIEKAKAEGTRETKRGIHPLPDRCQTTSVGVSKTEASPSPSEKDQNAGIESKHSEKLKYTKLHTHEV